MGIAWILSLILWMGGAEVPQATMKSTAFLEALCSEGPPADQKEKMTLYDALIGDWEVDVIDYAPDGTRRESKGEWYFAWVLDGRAIQDVFIVPSRSSRTRGQPVKITRYGTTIRVYDPVRNVWNVTWINPVNGSHNMLVGRKQGDEVLQEGKDPEGYLIRWIFSDITPNSFRWRGEDSTDQGKSWKVTAEFFGHRMSSVNSRR